MNMQKKKTAAAVTVVDEERPDGWKPSPGHRAVVEAIAEDIRNNPEFAKFLDSTPPESLSGDVRAALDKASPAPVAATTEPDDAPDSVGDLYDTAFHGMHAIASSVPADHGTLFGDLHNAADFSLVVFRDLLDGAVCAKSGASIEGVKDLIEANIEHAEHELRLLVSALRRAKSKLETVEKARSAAPAPKGPRRATKAERATS